MHSETVYLPALISAEFGTSPQEAQKQIRLGTVFIDDEPYQPLNSDEKIWLKRSLVDGKRVVVKADTHIYAVDVHEDPDE